MVQSLRKVCGRTEDVTCDLLNTSWTQSQGDRLSFDNMTKGDQSNKVFEYTLKDVHMLTDYCLIILSFTSALSWSGNKVCGTYDLGQVMRKRDLCHIRTTKAQISLRIRAV